MSAQIQEMADQFADLRPFMRMTVAPGVTVGQLNFVAALTHWSTALLSIAINNTIPSDVSVDLFQAGIGDTGQGYTGALTRGQTSWEDSQGRLPANQCFIATSTSFQLYRRDTAATGSTVAVETTVPNIEALHAIARALSWEETIGDGITRNHGPIAQHAGMGGVWAVPSVGSAFTLTEGAPNVIVGYQEPGFDVNAIIGNPDARGSKLPLPVIFPPNINVKLTVKGGTGFVVPVGNNSRNTLPSSTFLAIRQYLHGYLCTMPV